MQMCPHVSHSFLDNVHTLTAPSSSAFVDISSSQFATMGLRGREGSGLSMSRSMLPQRLSNLHIVILTGFVILFAVSGAYYQDVKTYLAKAPAVPDARLSDSIISGQDVSDHGVMLGDGDVREQAATLEHSVPGMKIPEHVVPEKETSDHKIPLWHKITGGGKTAQPPKDKAPDTPGHSTSQKTTTLAPRIPNIVHFTHISSNPDADFKFDFRQCLSIYSAWFYSHPDTIFIHTNATDAQIKAARRGEVGKWAKIVLDLPNVKVHQMEMPTHARNGVRIEWMAHVSDFVRVEMVSFPIFRP